MARTRILVTNDDGWDAPGLAALKTIAVRFGEVYVVAPRDAHSDGGHRITTNAPLTLTATGAQEFQLAGSPADCVRVALTALMPEIDWVLSGINRGGNLGVDIYSSGTVAAAREAAFLGKPAIAISQFLRRGLPLNWDVSAALAAPVIARLLATTTGAKEYWNVNLPHSGNGASGAVSHCEPDDEPLDVRFQREGDVFHYSGTYIARPTTPGRDTEQCFHGAVTVSRLHV